MNETMLLTGLVVSIALMMFSAARLFQLLHANTDGEQFGASRPSVLGWLTPLFALLPPALQSTKDKLKADLLRAGVQHRRAAQEYVALRNASMIGWIGVCGVVYEVLRQRGSEPALPLIALAVIVLGLLFAVPRVLLGSLASARVLRIQHAMPDALDMIHMLITGGLPLRQAISRVGVELAPIHRDLARELTIVDQQSEAASLDAAMRQFADRIRVPEVVALATTVRQADRLGGNVGLAFQEHADSVRRARKQRAEEQGNKASVKMLFPIVLFLAPPIYILLLGPAVLELKNFMQRETRPGGVLSQQDSEIDNGAATQP